MENIPTQLDGATNVLLKVPPLDEGRDTCTSLLSDGDAERNVLFVSFTRRASACVDQVADRSSIRNVGVIAVGNTPAGVDREGVVTESVSSASDLTGLGIQIGKFLSEWNEPVFVCFDSLTSMLQYVDYETAYEFLHAVSGQVYAAGAQAHFHVDPSAHNEQEIASITSLFDASVSLEGETEIRTRSLLEG
jgi:hypothetical protein